MPSLQTHNNSGRKKLVITKAPEAKQITGKDNKTIDFIEFMAKVEGEDSAVKYSVWSKALNEFIKLDAVVDCDVVVTDQKNLDQDGNPYKNRKVVQVYQEGKPVKEQQPGKSWGKSPETVAMEIDSKFRNTALMQACQANWLYVGAGSTRELVVNVLAVADQLYAWLKGETKPAVKAPEKPVDKESVQPAQQEASLPVVESPKPFVDILAAMKAVNWKDTTVKSWLKMQFKADTTGMLAEVLGRLDENQFNMLHNHLAEMKKAGVK